jgi:sialidase-1
MRIESASIAVALIASASIGCPTRAAAGSIVEVLETKVISEQPQFYHGWPTVALRRTGELLVVYSGGRDYHVCPFGRLEMITSRDGGANWTPPRVLADSATDDRDAGIVETSKGTLLATFYTSTAYQQHLTNPERLLNQTFGNETAAMLRRWKLRDEATSPQEKKDDFGHWMLRSTDGGVTWSPRYRVPGYNPHGPTNLADGRLFYAAANGKTSNAYLSVDDGVTWNLIAQLPVPAGELHGVQAADGRLVVQARVKNVTPEGRTQSTTQTTSTDGGRTWTPPQPVANGYPPHLVRLSDGALVMTYSWRQEPFGIRGKLSRNHGETWSDEFILTSDAATWDVGYPSTVQLPDATLLTIWYEAPKGSHKAVLRQARWKLNASHAEGGR